MKALSVFGKDMMAVFKKPLVLVSFVGVAVIPMLYSGFLIKGSWDPYGSLEKLPVAVVNLDKGASYEEEQLDVGKEFVEELKKNPDFDWRFVTAEGARDGMAHNKYYITITVPENFSEKAATVMDEKPQQAEIIFEPNSQYNYIAGQIGNSAVKELRAKLSAQITEAYTRGMLEQIDKVSDGLGEAGDGATKLADGAKKLEDGLVKLQEGAAKLADGTQSLKNGVGPLAGGAAKLHTGAGTLKQGASSLASGLTQLSDAQGKLTAGAEAARDGAGKLEAGLQSSAEGAGKLTTGLQSSAEGAATLSSGLASAAEASKQVAGGAQQVADGLAQLLKANPQLAANAQVNQLLAASQAVAQGSASLRDGQSQLAAGAAQLEAGQRQLLGGAQQLEAGQQQLLGGARQLASGQDQLLTGMNAFAGKLGEAAAGGRKLADGAGDLTSGLASLKRGLGKVAGGVGTLAEGTKELGSGTGELKDGSAKLVDGSGELADKLTDAATKTAEVKTGDETVSMFSDPVKIVENDDRKVEKYGIGIAPYFLSLALFMGGLVFTTIFSVRDSVVPNASRFGLFLSKTLTFVVMSAAQSAIVATVVLFVLDIHVQSAPLFYLFAFMASLAFAMIIQSFVTWLDNPGRFLVIILMIFQLTSSAGTFPLELLPGWMQTLNPWLPMTHSIIGLKAVIASGDFSLMWEQLANLAVYAVVFVLLTFAYFMRRKPAMPMNETAASL
ncbi:YhgE/Pip family protein [Paenibacillus methanolicus]|uniref:Putative membrane protein n=1 Tax=Paenibacillus methanolicus TaxID=582686 RepID=A0A5S5BRG7_9BACL|nr:YhgE/Pip domain-containing protein [Paenibacillus methanolicus]TYP69577.1 putative membrane protein [Paenibacillus methanolicus]